MVRSIETARELHLGLYIRATCNIRRKASWIVNNMRKIRKNNLSIFLGECS